MFKCHNLLCRSLHRRRLPFRRASLALATPVLKRARNDSGDADTDRANPRGVVETSSRIGEYLVVAAPIVLRLGLPRENIQWGK